MKGIFVKLSILFVCVYGSYLLIFSESRLDKVKVAEGTLQPGELTPHFNKKLGQHLDQQSTIPNNSIVFIGDSITEEFNLKLVTNNGVNYGISMDTSAGLIERISKYEILSTASKIFLLIGVNDIHRYNRSVQDIENNYVKMLEMLPGNVPIVFCDILPVDESLSYSGYNSRIKKYNEVINKLSRRYANVEHLPLYETMLDWRGNLKSEYHIGDAVHLSDEGYRVLAEKMKLRLFDSES